MGVARPGCAGKRSPFLPTSASSGTRDSRPATKYTRPKRPWRGLPPRCSYRAPSSSTCSISPVCGHPLPSGAEVKTTIPEPIPALLGNLRGVAATVGDKILTPLRWNALADVVYGHSRFKNPVERNALVRCLFDPDFIAFLGAEREALVFRAVGMFRLNYSSQRPSPFADAVYEKVKDDPLFQWAWNRRVVAGELAHENVMVRNHPLVGRIAVYAIDLSVPARPDLLLRILVPGDEETAAKFNRLEGVEKSASNRSIARSTAVGYRS